MDDPRGAGTLPARSRIRDKVSLVAGLLGLATAVGLGVLLYMGRDYTEQTEPSWWWTALIACGLATGVFGLLSIIFNTGSAAEAPAPPAPPRARTPRPEPSAQEPWADVPTEAVPFARPDQPNGGRAAFEAPPSPATYTALYRREEHGWFTEVEEVPGCSVYAPTLYAARAGILEALAAWLGGRVEGRQVVDDVELPQEVADAVGRAASAKGSPDAPAELAHAVSVLVNQFALDRADAAALLAVSPTEVDDALEARPNGPDDWSDDAAFSPWEAGSSAP